MNYSYSELSCQLIDFCARVSVGQPQFIDSHRSFTVFSHIINLCSCIVPRHSRVFSMLPVTQRVLGTFYQMCFSPSTVFYLMSFVDMNGRSKRSQFSFGIPISVFFNLHCCRRYFHFLKRSSLRVCNFVAWLFPHVLSERCHHRWLVEMDAQSSNKRQGTIANFLILIMFTLLLPQFHLLDRILPHCRNTVYLSCLYCVQGCCRGCFSR